MQICIQLNKSFDNTLQFVNRSKASHLMKKIKIKSKSLNHNINYIKINNKLNFY